VLEFRFAVPVRSCFKNTVYAILLNKIPIIEI